MMDTTSLTKHLRDRNARAEGNGRTHQIRSATLPVVEKEERKFTIPGASWLEASFKGIETFLETFEYANEIPPEAKVIATFDHGTDELALEYEWWVIRYHGDNRLA